MSDEESSFVILGSTPTPSMEHYNGHEHSMAKENGSSINDSVMQSSAQTMKNFSLINPSLNSPSLSATNGDNLKNDSLVYSVVNKENQPNEVYTASGNDFAEQLLMGEIPADSLKYSILKQFPSLCTSQTKEEDIGKLEGLLSEHYKLKDNLHKTNEAMHQHFSTMNEWHNRVKELKENQAAEIAKCTEINANLQEELRLKTLENENLQIALTERDEFNQTLKIEIARIKEEHEEKTMQFNMNLAYAAGENKDLVQEISDKTAIIQNMTNLIEKLEKQAVASFELVSVQHNEQQNRSLNQTQNQSLNQSQNQSLNQGQNENSLITSQHYSDFAAQLNAAREQNMQLLEDVSNKISTIKRLENESSKLQHQLLSLEMIVNENGQKSTEDTETVHKLKDELNQMSIQNMQIQEMKTDYVQQIEQLKESLAREEGRNLKANTEIQNLNSQIAAQDRNLMELSAKIMEQQTELNNLQKANVILRSKEINADIQTHQKEEAFTEVKEQNEFLKAQLDVYKSDFEMERQARQDIANEREELLSDLKLLQRRNQQLIDEAQSRTRLTNAANTSNGASSFNATNSFNAATPSNATAPPQIAVTAEPGRPSIGKFICPVCNTSSPSLMALQNHVQSCLDN